MTKTKLLIINASLNGNHGNTFHCFKKIESLLNDLCEIKMLELKKLNQLSSKDYQQVIEEEIKVAVYLKLRFPKIKNGYSLLSS